MNSTADVYQDLPHCVKFKQNLGKPTMQPKAEEI